MSKKKVSLIVGYSLLAVIGIAIILCALIPVRYMPEVKDPQYVTISSLSNSRKQVFYDVNSQYFNKDGYNEFMDEFKSSFSQSVLTAMFTGKLSSNQEVYPNPDFNYPTEGYKITFGYLEYQKIMLNGKVYKDPTYSTRDAEYKTMNCYISDEEGFVTFYMYFEDDSESTTVVYRMNTIASTKGLYNYISELDTFKD